MHFSFFFSNKVQATQFMKMSKYGQPQTQTPRQVKEQQNYLGLITVLWLYEMLTVGK